MRGPSESRVSERKLYRQYHGKRVLEAALALTDRKIDSGKEVLRPLHRLEAGH